MEGVGSASADSRDATGSPDAPDPVFPPEASLELPPKGVRPMNEHFGRMQRRSFERNVFEALSYRNENKAASLLPLNDIILHRMRTVFGIEIPEQRIFWPYDRSELSPLLDEIEFLNTPPQRFSVNQPADVLSHPDKLPLLAAELARQRAGMIDRLRRMGWGTVKRFSSDSMPFFDGGSREVLPEAPEFRIEQVYETPINDIVPNVASADPHNQFFFRLNSASLGVSPGRQASRARRGRKGVLCEFRSFVEVYRGGHPYNYGAEGC